MDLSASILGSTISRRLQDRIAQPVLTIGRDRFSRGELAKVQCFNYLAAYMLNRALDDITVKDTADFYERIPPSALALPHIGSVALAVLGAAFEARGVGGSTPLESWVKKHSQNLKRPLSTFNTIKLREQRAARAEKAESRRRRRAHPNHVPRTTSAAAVHTH